MAQITLKQLQTFVAVADLASFRRAADRLNTTQPNISSRITGLEAQLGVTLMERDAGSVRLTPLGETLLVKARSVLHGVDDLVGAVGDATLLEGTLRLGVTEMIVHSWLGEFLTALKDRFPGIDVDLTVDLSANLSEALFARALDLALQSGPFPQRISGSVPLGNYPFAWVAAPALDLPSHAMTVQELTQHPILTHARGTLPHDQLLAHIKSLRGSAFRLFPSTNMVACLQMTREGLGIACVPRVMVKKEIETGDLVLVQYDWSPDALGFAARYDADTVPSYVAEIAKIAETVSLHHNVSR